MESLFRMSGQKWMNEVSGPSVFDSECPVWARSCKKLSVSFRHLIFNKGMDVFELREFVTFSASERFSVKPLMLICREDDWTSPLNCQGE